MLLTKTNRRRMLVAALATTTATPLAAQTLQGLDNYSLPATTPTPAVTPIPAPIAPVIVPPAPTPTPAPRVTPSPTPTARPLPTPPRPIATPTPTPPILATPLPSATPAAPLPSPAPTATPVAAPSEPVAGQGSTPWWLAGVAALVAIAAFAWFRNRRPRDRDEPREEAPPTPAPTPVSPPEPIATPPAPRPTLDVALRPTRAGLNMLSATVEAELTVVNTGDTPATDIRVALVLLSAHAEQGAEIADHYARPIARPAIPVFSLAPGETRVARIVVALPRAAIKALTAGNRPMFVPVVAANCRYLIDGATGQTARSFVVGIERDGVAKLGPFWLDAPAKMHDRVAARVNAPAVAR